VPNLRENIMIKLDYDSYLKEKDFDFEKQYYSDLKTKTKFDTNENIEEKYNRYVKNGAFREIFYGYTLKDIVLANSEKIQTIIMDIEEKINRLTQRKQKNLKTTIENLFKYTNKYQGKALTPFFTDNFNFRTCFYCNKDFITNFDKTSTFQLDHFYDKGSYPYLALSLYNLIPSCSTCNSSKVKGSKNTYEHDPKVGSFKNETCLAPNNKDFDFDQKVKFKLLLSDSCKNLQIKTKEDIETPLKENYSNEYDKYREIFKLNERYKAHKDIVYEMMQNAQLYPESRLKELQDLTGIPYQQIKKDIFNLIDEDVDLSKEPFSKLKQDISKELGLI